VIKKITFGKLTSPRFDWPQDWFVGELSHQH